LAADLKVKTRSSTPSHPTARRADEALWRKRISLLRRDALAGNLVAMRELGELFQQGIRDRDGRVIVRRRPRAGFEMLLRAGVDGDTSAAFPLGYAYDSGLGTRRDRWKALRWYRRAWRGGNSTAALNVANVYRHEREFRLAFQWWKRAADLGDGDGAVDAGYCYQYGIGTRPSSRRARRMYERALASKLVSARGREEAMYYLALVHLDGGRPRLARPLLVRASADGDFPEAEALLAEIRSRKTAVPCRCRLDIVKTLPGHAPCPRHPRSTRRGAAT
jgi:TPR repeat protein